MGKIYKRLACGCIIGMATFSSRAGGDSVEHHCDTCSPQDIEDNVASLYHCEIDVYNIATLVKDFGWIWQNDMNRDDFDDYEYDISKMSSPQTCKLCGKHLKYKQPQ